MPMSKGIGGKIKNYKGFIMLRIAIPVANNQLCLHFGHCEIFRFFDVDESSKTIISHNDVEPPPHEPGLLPRWIREQGANVVLAGGIGAKAKKLFEEASIHVIVGAVEKNPEVLVLNYLKGSLATGPNSCDH